MLPLWEEMTEYDLSKPKDRDRYRAAFIKFAKEAQNTLWLNSYDIKLQDEEWDGASCVAHARTSTESEYLHVIIQLWINDQGSSDSEQVRQLAYHEMGHVLLSTAVMPYERLLDQILSSRERERYRTILQAGEEAVVERLARALLRGS